jgi:glycosyltransferase involved in cell wall biosynthesis
MSDPKPVPQSVLTFIMPAYNEEGDIADAIDDVRKAAFDLVPGCTILVVDDGSRDRTGQIVDAISAADPRVRVIHKPNGGHGSALIAGLNAAASEFVFLLDSDRQIPMDHFAEFWKAAPGRDAVIGVRARRHDPRGRVVLAKIIQIAIFGLFGVWLRDANVPYKLLRLSVWKSASRLVPVDTLAPSLFIAIFMRFAGAQIVEKEVAHRQRDTGEVSIRHLKLARFCLKGFGQLLHFRWRLARGLASAATWVRPDAMLDHAAPKAT